MPSWELFEQESEDYRNHVLPPGVSARVGIEAGIRQGWRHYVGDEGEMIGIDHCWMADRGSFRDVVIQVSAKRRNRTGEKR